MSIGVRAILLALAAGLASGAWGAPEIKRAPTRPRVGEVIFLSMSPEKEVLRASVTWGRSSYQLLPTGQRYEAVLPVSLTTKPGGYHATIYWKYTDGTMGSQKVSVEVQPRQFGIQHLTLSSKQASAYSSEDTARERRLIGEALDLVSPDRLWTGNFAMPLQGRISTQFGLQRYVNGAFDYRHRGVDIAAPEGTPVRASAAGLVSLADDAFILHGQTIIVDHGQGVATLYLHLSRILVSPGEAVRQGQIIGAVGETGVATGPHLHYAVYAQHEAVDPFFWTKLPEETE
jgi:hypothetical protein